MKHAVAVAILNGMQLALGTEVENGTIPMQNAVQAGRFGMMVAKELLKGNSIFGKKLQDFASDGEYIEGLLVGEKINLQKFGDV